MEEYKENIQDRGGNVKLSSKPEEDDKVPRTQTKLSCMLEKLGLKYEGRPHSGLDDSRNIAHIAMRMLQDGCQLRINERMHEGQLRTVPSSAPVEGAPPPHTPRSRDLGSASPGSESPALRPSSRHPMSVLPPWL